MEIIKLPRRGGKTTRALQILKENEKSILIIPYSTGLPYLNAMEFPILGVFPDLLKRIITMSSYKRFTRGRSDVDTLIIDNADLVQTFDLLKLIRECPYDLIFTLTGDNDE